jgi:Fe2+ or Zn2+ uptake regulation protein
MSSCRCLIAKPYQFKNLINEDQSAVSDETIYRTLKGFIVYENTICRTELDFHTFKFLSIERTHLSCVDTKQSIGFGVISRNCIVFKAIQ